MRGVLDKTTPAGAEGGRCLCKGIRGDGQLVYLCERNAGDGQLEEGLGADNGVR